MDRAIPYAVGVLALLCALSWSVSRAAPLVSDPTTNAIATDKVASSDTSAPATDDDPITDLHVAWLSKRYPDLAAGWDKLRSNDSHGALDIFRTVSGREPGLPPEEVLAAIFYLEQRNGTELYHWLDESVEKHPKDAEAYLILGNLALAQSRYTEATLLLQRGNKLLESASADQPRLKALKIRFLKSLSQVDVHFEHWGDARARLEELVKLAPDSGMAHLRFGNVLLRLNERQLGFDELQTAYKLDKKLPTPPIAVAMYCLETKQQSLADKWMAYAESKYGKDPATRTTLGAWAWQSGAAEDAKRHATAIVQLDPKLVAGQLLLGMVAQYQGDLNTAQKHYDEALRIAPDDLQVRDHLIMALIASTSETDRSRAQALAEENVSKFPNDSESVALLGWVQWIHGSREEAARTLGTVLRGNLSPDAAYYIARVLAETSQKDQAAELLANMLKAKTLFVNRKNAEQLLKELKQ